MTEKEWGIKAYIQKRVYKSVHIPKDESRKGNNGKVLMVSGSKYYHGSALFSVKAAIPFVDLVYAFVPDGDAFLIQSLKTIPEVIVLRTRKEILNLLNRRKIDSVLVGPGLWKTVNKVKFSDFSGLKLILDADAIPFYKKVKASPESVIITPHKGEFIRAFGKVGTKDTVVNTAKNINACILLKGCIDYLSDGRMLIKNNLGNAGMTKGGTGDVLSGVITAFASKMPIIDAAALALYTCCSAADRLFKQKLYYYTASDIINTLPTILGETVKAVLKKKN